MPGSDSSRPYADIRRTQRHDDECVCLRSSRLAATPFRDGGQGHQLQVGINYRMQRRSKRHWNWLLKLAAPGMKLVAWFSSRLEDTRALGVVQDCSTATILHPTGMYAPGFSSDRCREQGLSPPISFQDCRSEDFSTSTRTLSELLLRRDYVRSFAAALPTRNRH